MANFPASPPGLITNSNPLATLAAAGHTSLHNRAAEEINAIADRVGITGDTDQDSHAYKLSGITGSDKAVSKTGIETLTNKTLTSPTINTPTIDTPTIATPSVTNGTFVTPTFTTPSMSDPSMSNPSVTGVLSVASEITQAGAADHLVLTPGASKLVKMAVLEQDDTTDTYVNDEVVLTGWGYWQGNGVDTLLTKNINFGVTFLARPKIVITLLGGKGSSAPTHIGDFGDYFAQTGGNWWISPFPYATSTSGSTISARVENAPSNVTFLGFSWIAIGPI
jgi:hypothetical protein